MITISVNAQDFPKKLRKIAERFQDRRIWNLVGQDVWNDTMRHFQKEVDEDGKTWPRWRIGNKRYSSRPGWGSASKMLQKTGDMREKIIWKPSSDGVKIENYDTPYAKYHHYGTSKMDKRRFLYMTDKELLKKIRLIITEIFK